MIDDETYTGNSITKQTFFNQRLIRHYLQRRYARRGDTAILQVAGQRSEFDAGGDESTQFVGVSILPHP